MKPKISIITLGVKDLDASRTFYESLGFKRNGDDEGYVLFEMEGTWLGLFPKDKLAEDASVDAASLGSGGVTLARNEPSKEAVDKTIEEARSVGATITKEPQEVFWGGYSGYFTDPDGYLWEVAYNPFTDLS